MWEISRPRGSRRAGRLAVVLVTLACSNPFTVTEGDIEVTAGENAFTVRNRSALLEAAFVIVELEESAVVDLAPCEEWPTRVAPLQSRVVPYLDVMGFDEQAEAAIVSWCLLDADQVIEGGSLHVPFR